MTRRGGRSRRGRRGGRDEQLPETPISDLRWVLLDHFVHFSKSGGDEAVADGTRSEVADTSTGKPIAVSLRVASPPAVSRLYIHFPEGLWPELKELSPPPSVVAAHGRSILFQTRVPDVDQCHPSDCPVDYFVYTASGRSGKRPSLRRLPPCFEFGPVGPVVNGIQKQRMMTRDDMGLLCRGDEGFTVAELSFCGELCLLHHAPEKADFEWDVRTLQMPYGKGVPEDLLCGSWNTDVVVPFGDSLCWVDCYLGLLFVSVHGDLTTAKQPRHVPMPADLDPRRLYIDGGSPDPARRVCVTDGGMIKLICVSDLAGRSMHIYSSNFKIRTWNLINGIWEEDVAIEGHKFEDILASDKRLPRLLPEYPTMSLVDHDVVCFVLNNTSRISWLVEVNLKKKVLGAVTLYINEENEDQAAAQGGEEETLEEFLLKLFYNTIFSNPFAFIPSQLTMYLDKHAIKSLGYSKKLQKAEVKRAIKNGWIKHRNQGLA